MANFGLSRLAVVAPYAPTWREARSAVGAPQLLQDALEFATLPEAVAECTLVVGTGSLTYRKPRQPVVVLPSLAPVVARELRLGGRTAIVFGSEKHGLTGDDLSICHSLVEIPTDTSQPSMNLGQAVAVCLYELATRVEAADASQTEAVAGPREPRAHSGVLDRLAALTEEVMQAAGYSPRSMQAANHRDLALMLRRLVINEQDTRRIMGLFRRILWRLNHTADPSEKAGHIDKES